jgi:flavorubredoxin
MKAIRIKEGVYWVGGIDWGRKTIDGITTPRGTSYNAYLIIDERVTLIDTVRHTHFGEMFERIASVIDPAKIDLFVCNSIELDHSGSLATIWKMNRKATVVTSLKGQQGLQIHYGALNFMTVQNNNDSIKIGKRNLRFILTPMLAWPGSLMTYCPEEKVLFSGDLFCQHLAGIERFDAEQPLPVTIRDAEKVYANILLPSGNQVRSTLSEIANLDIEMFAPGHGLIWRQYLTNILHGYTRWSANETEKKAVIIYDTLWQSTRLLAHAIIEGFEAAGISCELFCLDDTHFSDVMASLCTARYICIGSPTQNSGILPTVAGFLAYVKGLAPKKRTGLAFGSYGWGGQSIGLIHLELQSIGFTMWDPVRELFVPQREALKEITEKVKGYLS